VIPAQNLLLIKTWFLTMFGVADLLAICLKPG